jgi:sensor histidine kinase regulating citrate/malate metabolism
MIDLAGLLLANIVNYYLLDNILRVQQLKQRESQLNQQVNVQLDKYQQISQAYRSSRSFIHDIKKQYFYIQECLNKHKYDEIEIFLTDALQELEQTAAKVNTGNLVIDSFVSTHMALAEQEGIQFQTRLQIELEKIPLNDYDLCLILGNLLDNSYQECHKIPNSFFRQIRIEIYTSQLDMLIHVANTVNETEYLLKKENNNALYHGYGTANIERITKKYQGTYTNSIENGFYHAIVSIPYISK